MLVEIFYHIDEFCKAFEETIKIETEIKESNSRNKIKTLSLSEIMTIAIYYHHSGYQDFKSYYKKHVEMYMRNDFSKIVSYNRFIELKAKIAIPLYLFLKVYCATIEQIGKSIVDSTKLQVCNNRRIYSHKVFKGMAQRGQTSMGWFYGFKLHLVINPMGEIINFYLSTGNVADNNADLLEKLTKNIFGKIFGDKGYLLNQKVYQKFHQRGLTFITKTRSNMKSRLYLFSDALFLKSRSIIETIIGVLKNTFRLEHSRHRSPKNFLSHILSTLVAYAFKPNKPSIIKKVPFDHSFAASF